MLVKSFFSLLKNDTDLLLVIMVCIMEPWGRINQILDFKQHEFDWENKFNKGIIFGDELLATANIRPTTASCHNILHKRRPL